MANSSARINKIMEMCKLGVEFTTFNNQTNANVTNNEATSSILDNSTDNFCVAELEPETSHIISLVQPLVTTDDTTFTMGACSSASNIVESSSTSAYQINSDYPSASRLSLSRKSLTNLEDNVYQVDTLCSGSLNLENGTELPGLSAPRPITPAYKDFSSGSSDVWEPSHSEKGMENSSESGPVESESSEDNIPLAQIVVRKRRRGQGPMQRKLRKIRTENRKKGESYVTAKGKCIPARRPIPLYETCRAKCHEKTANINLNEVFKDYRNLPSRDTQKRYLASLITVKPKERIRRSKSAKNREVTVLYKVEGAHGNICKNCFLKVFGETRGFLDDAIKKKKRSPTSIILETDLRRGHPPGNKRSEADITCAKDFINSIPAYESHYSRRHTTKRYLEPNMNLQLLYTLYKEKFFNTTNPTAKPISLSVFRNVFKTLNLKFKKPSNDTCKTCDSLSLKIKSCVSEETKRQLENELTQHQDKASFHYETKRADKKISEESSGKTIVAAFDLQKCLATPHLTASVSFYKRKLWTFNLTVRNITAKRTACFVWHEGVAQRGADEIASCLLQFIKNLPENVEKLILYSDTCPGQNRNSILPVMFMVALEKKRSLKEIHHKFLVPGHTHLECDTDHAAIERCVNKRNSTISIPHDWVSIIKMTSTRYDVKLMKQTDFFGFSRMLNTHFTKRNVAKDKTSFAWNSIFWFCYKIASDVGFKYSLNSDEPFRFFSMQKRGKSVSMANIQLPLAYTAPVPIDVLKYRNILDLLPYIDDVYHDFYKNLKHTQSKTTSYMSDSDEQYDE